jgi:gliding motility-associated-like protein
MGTGANSYQWSTSASGSLITVSPLATTVFSLFGTSNNCTSVAPVTVQVVPTPTLSSGNYSLCIGSTNATLVASGASVYSWSPSSWLSSNNSSIVIASPAANTIYTLQGFNSVCTSSILVSVNAYTTPAVTIQSPGNFICKGSSITLTATGANSYQWEPSSDIINSTSPAVNLIPLVTSTFSVLGYGQNNCVGVATTTINVLITPQTFAGSESYDICQGSKTELTASGADNYIWSPQNGLSSITQSVVTASPQSSQIYTVTGYSGIIPNICSSSVTMQVNVLPYSNIHVSAPDSICYAEKTTLSASGAKNFTWTPAHFLNNYYTANPILSATSSIIYTITGVGNGSCAGTTTLSLVINAAPYVYAGRDTLINFDQFTYLNGKGNGWLYTWSSSDEGSINCINCPTTYINPSNSACYRLEVENSHGCKASDEVCVQVTKEYAIYIPDSFTPNGDGLNELFTPLGFGIISFDLLIYNRWGEKLFEGNGSFTKGQLVSWDGNYKGEQCPQGSYVYKFIYTLPGNKTLSREGEVVLLGQKH